MSGPRYTCGVDGCEFSVAHRPFHAEDVAARAAASPVVEESELDDHPELLASKAVQTAFIASRRKHVRSPEEGADSIDAAVGSALNDAEETVLAYIEDLPALLASDSGGLDVERLARALHAFYAGKDTRDEFFPPDCTHRDDARIIAVAYAADDPNAAIAAEYARLSGGGS